MHINIIYIYFLLLNVKGIQENSDEFYDCINPDKTINSPSECTSIKIPDSDGYKCCSMKISFNDNNTYSCFTLENEFTKSQKIFEEYFTNQSIASLFGTIGGQMEIECGEKMILTQNYEKMSDEYLNCYKSHINGVENENDCQKYDIPKKEKSKCCFLESIQKDNKGNIIKDKRCNIIQDEYFTKEKNLNNYLMEKSNLKNLEQVKNINITINCKNYDVFYFISKFEETPSSNIDIKKTEILLSSTDINLNDEDDNIPPILSNKKESGSNIWIIVVIVIVSIVFLIGGVILVFYFIRKRKSNLNMNNNEMKEQSSNNIAKNDISSNTTEGNITNNNA